MSYDLCEIEECFFTNPFSPLIDENYHLNPFKNNTLDTPFDENDQIAPTTTNNNLSSSPPCHYTYQMGNSVNSLDLCPLEIKTEESQSQLPFYDSYINSNSFLPHSYDGCDNLVKMMQRGLIGSSNLQSQNLTFPDHDSSCHMRRICSTGDLHRLETKQTSQTMEEANLKVGRYNPEERKERILRYKAKKMQRNFNKTIKYACRKTLADNRPRIRGRFARNADESGETPKTFTFQRYGDEDELWTEGLQQEYHEEVARGQFFDTYMPTAQFHQFSYFRR